MNNFRTKLTVKLVIELITIKMLFNIAVCKVVVNSV